MNVELRDIHKHYGTVAANAGVDLRVTPGTVHGILGENGAGKSTLMKILAGAVRPSGGQILLDNRATVLDSPASALKRGIGMLYQEPLDFAPLSVLENFSVGVPSSPGFHRRRQALAALSRDLGFALAPDLPVERLTVGERQQLELTRLLFAGAQVLILDEPTTGISPAQRQCLFTAIGKMAARGKSILLVTHKLADVASLCDRVTVLRQGKVAGTMERPFDPEALLAMMFEAPPAGFRATPGRPGNPLLTFSSVSATGGRCGLIDCTVAIRQGEVVGLAGLEGSGQGVFLRLAAGLVPPRAGAIRLNDRLMNAKTHRAFKQNGVAFVPAARLEEALISGLSLTEHFVLASQTRGFWVDHRKAGAACRRAIATFLMKAAPETPAEALSGGNQQRLLLSLIDPNASLLLLENPTRGLDVASMHWVWRHLCATEARRTIVFSSTDIDEILMVAERVLVFYEGRVVLDLPADKAHPEILGRAISGTSG